MRTRDNAHYNSAPIIRNRTNNHNHYQSIKYNKTTMTRATPSEGGGDGASVGSAHSYQRADDNADGTLFTTTTADRRDARRTLVNFIFMSIFFSANHGCVVACLSLATTRLGSIGAWQSGVLYLTYTGSAVLGATYVVKQLGARNALMTGMLLYCAYVACFLVATWIPATNVQTPVALLGAAIGGIGAGFLWTAQGSYFGRAAEDHASRLQQTVGESNARLASIFAFIYLAEEVALRALSTVLLEWGLSWSVVFGSYASVAVLSTLLMVFVYDYSTTESYGTRDATASSLSTTQDASSSSTSVWYKVTAAWQLLRRDPKMKYMIGLNAVFGFTAAFLNSYINGEVVKQATNDDKATSVGMFNAWVSCVAAAMSLVFGRLSSSGRLNNGAILIVGALCFSGVVFPFLVLPDASQWNVPLLFMVYTFHGTGRATFEGNLKATFADYFAYEKEGAFANIILQNGLSGAIGYVLTFTLLCSEESRYCIRYSDGTLHDVLSFELLVVLSAVMAIVGYLRASALYREERRAVPGGGTGNDGGDEDADSAAMVPLSSGTAA